MATINDIVAGYLKLRKMKADIVAEQKKALKPINEKMQKLEAFMLAFLQHENAQSIKTEAGTPYIGTDTKISYENWGATLEFLVANDLLHMLDHKLDTEAVESYLAANGELPPGVSITRSAYVNVRSA